MLPAVVALSSYSIVGSWNIDKSDKLPAKLEQGHWSRMVMWHGRGSLAYMSG